jgi:hypothetical protein
MPSEGVNWAIGESGLSEACAELEKGAQNIANTAPISVARRRIIRTPIHDVGVPEICGDCTPQEEEGIG